MLNLYLKNSLKGYFLKNTGINRATLATILLVTAMIGHSFASVTVGVASGGTNISADNAANATTPAYTTLGNIVITEGLANDISTGTNKTLILTAPAGWQFKPATGSVSFTAAKDITAASIAVTAATITVTVTVGGTANIDLITISGIQVEATDGGNALAANVNILRTSGNPGTLTVAGITNSTTSFGALSQSLGAISQLVVTLPGQTFTDAATKAGSGNSGTVTGQTAGTSFNIVSITATDQFFNVITTYSGAKTISYSGPSNGPTGGAPVYTTSVSFTSGVATTTLATTLKKAETTTITATDGTVAGVASSALTVSSGALNNFLVEAAGGGTIATQTVGASFNIQITARDIYNNTVTGYNTSGAVTTNAGTISPTTTGTGYVNGVNTLSVSFTGISGSGRTITITQGSTGTSAPFKVDPGVLNNFLVEKNGSGGNIGTQTAGNSFSIQITARDASNNALSSGINTFSGTVNLTTSAGSISPAITGTFTNGALTGLSVTLTAADATQTIIATSGAVSTGSTAFTVVANSATRLQILLPGETAAPGTVSGKTGTPTAVNAGTPVTATVNAVDAYWNLVTTTTDNIHLTSPDIYPATIPANAALVAGTKNFSVTLFTGPTETITASDVTNGSITASTSAAVTVNPVTYKTTSTGGNWNSTGTWVGGVVPATTDNVIIVAGASVTVTANTTIASITFDSTSATTSTLTVNSGKLLNVTGAISLDANQNTVTGALLTGSGTIDCDSINVGGNIAMAGSSNTTTITSTISTLNISGDVNINSYDFNPAKYNQAIFAIPSGVVTVSGTINMSSVGPNHGHNIDPELAMNTGAQTGTLILKGTNPINTNGNAVVALDGSNANVNYAGASSQTVYPTVYKYLTLSSSGNDSISLGTAINGVLNIVSPAQAYITPGLNITAAALSFNNSGQVTGSWGSTASTATHTSNTFFATTTGKVTVINKIRVDAAYSGLTASQSICYNNSIVLTGTVKNGTTYPLTSESIYATVNGTTQSATIGSSGTFTINFPSTSLLTLGSSFSIDYFYGGDTSLNAAEDFSTTLTVYAPSVGGNASATSTSLCSGLGTTITLAGDTGTIQWQQSSNGTSGWATVSGGSGGTTATYTTPNLSSTIYYRAVVTDGACPSANSTTASIAITNSGLWLGTSSTNWNDGGNWCPGTPPTSTTDVIIPSGTTYPPIISTTAACHNLTINSGAILTVNTGGDLSLYGNLTISGSYTHTAGTLELTGSSNQSIPAISVTNLVVNNTSGGVTLSGNIKVSNTLTLTRGVVTTGVDSVIVSNSTNTSIIAGAGNTNYTISWVNGYLKRSFTTASASYDFPLGTSAKGYLAKINSHSLTGVSYFTAIFAGPLVQAGNNINSRLIAWETGLSGHPETPYTSINATGSWKIEPNAQPTGATYDITLYFAGFTGMADNEFGILKRPVTSTDYADFNPGGGTLSATGGAGRTMAGGFALRNGLSSFSEFAIGLSGNVLPIQMVSFTAEKCDNNQDALLKWNTASELNNDHFNVEAATVIGQDGNLIFNKLGEVKGSGTSDIAHNYSFTDVTPDKNGNRYYRLGQVDVDGTVTYSDIIDVDFSGSPILTTKLYPNPTNDIVNYSITASDNAGVTISVTNINGQEIFMEQTNISTGSNTLSMDVSQLIPGIYFFNVNDGKTLSIHTRFEKF